MEAGKEINDYLTIIMNLIDNGEGRETEEREASWVKRLDLHGFRAPASTEACVHPLDKYLPCAADTPGPRRGSRTESHRAHHLTRLSSSRVGPLSWYFWHSPRGGDI